MTVDGRPRSARWRTRAQQRTGAFGEDALIVCDSLVRIYQSEGVEVQALQGLDLLVEDGELVAIVGASGSGKSTLLSVLSGLDVPDRRARSGSGRGTSGDVERAAGGVPALDGRLRLAADRPQPGALPDRRGERRASRSRSPGSGRKERDRRAAELLDVLGVGYCADRRPGQMSGGEQQRVAIAVALANAPQVLFADEPTGELDSATSHDVLEGLRTVNRELGTTVVVVTHDPRRQRARAAHRGHPRRAHQLGGRAAHPHRATTAPSTSSPRSSRCSTAPAACSCPASTATR